MTSTPFKTQVSTPRATIAPTVIVIEKMAGCGTCDRNTAGSASTCRTNLDDFEKRRVLKT